MIPKTWENPVKTALREGKPVVGMTITAASVEVAAQAAQLGFDFLWIEMEHSPITLETLRNIVLATRGLYAVPFARVRVFETWTARCVLVMGVRCVDKGGLAAEMLEQRTLGGARRRRNLARRRCLGSALGEQRYRGAQDRRADRRGGFAARLATAAVGRIVHGESDLYRGDFTYPGI